MKLGFLVAFLIVILIAIQIFFSTVVASGETNNSVINSDGRYDVKVSFDVKTDVSFPDLTKTVYDKQLKKNKKVTHKAMREILIAARVGFLEGFEDGTFRPDESITRAQFIKMLMILATNRTFDFNEIQTTYKNWAGKFVSLAEMQEIIEKGKYSEKELEEPITRIEVICMLAKVQLKMKGISLKEEGHLIFTDIDDLTEEERKLLLHAASYDLLEGMKDGKVTEIEPRKYITRAETARALVRIY